MNDLITSTDQLPALELRVSEVEQWDEQLVSKRRGIFSGMCSRLSDEIRQNRSIQERTLVDFGKSVLWITNDAVERLPESFDELANQIYDYWLYELENDWDLERKYSYIRLFQMISMIKAHYAERELNEKVHAAMREHKPDSGLVGLIQHSPGITHGKLREKLKLSSADLSGRLKPLEKEGVISGRRSGEERYYMLTNAGEVVHQRLCESPGWTKWKIYQ